MSNWYNVSYRLIGTYKILKKIHEFIQNVLVDPKNATEKSLLEFLDRYHHYNEHSLDNVNGYFLSSEIDKWQTLRIETQEQEGDTFLDMLSERYPTLRIIYFKEDDENHKYVTNDWIGKYFPAKEVEIKPDGTKQWFNTTGNKSDNIYQIKFDEE